MKSLMAITLLLAVGGAAVSALAEDPLLMDLGQQTEKWFHSEIPGKFTDLRLRTINGGLFRGATIQRHETYHGETLIETRRLLYSAAPGGDILFHGDLDAYVLEEPIVWIDAPLAVGKTWTQNRPALEMGDPTLTVHYVFAVLEQETIVCPMGEFQAYRLYISTVYPDGTSVACNQWFTSGCGMVRTCNSNQRMFLLNKVLNGWEDPPDRDDPFDPDQKGLLGTSSKPNPFNPRTSIRFTLPERLPVSLDIYDISGKLVTRVADGLVMDSGRRTLVWGGLDDRGAPAASGVYVYRILAGKLEETNRMTLVR